MQKEWREVPGFEGKLLASNLGALRTIDRIDCAGRFRKGIILKVGTQKTGHLRVKISFNRVHKAYSVHRLIALAWIPNPKNHSVVNHLDGNPANNRVDNLEWTTFLGNNLHAISMGTLTFPFGEQARHFKSKILAIDKDGSIKDILVGNRDMLEKGYDSRLISACLFGRQKTHRGCTFRRETDETSSNANN